MFPVLRSLAVLFVAATLWPPALAWAETGAKASEPRIELVGFSQPLVLNEAMLRSLPRIDYVKAIHGEEAKWGGARLSDVLARAGAPFGEKLRGAALKDVLRVQAADGYVVVFSPAEFDEAFGSNGAFLAYEREGKALSAEEGPFRLIIPGDNRAARSVRQVTKIELRRLD